MVAVQLAGGGSNAPKFSSTKGQIFYEHGFSVYIFTSLENRLGVYIVGLNRYVLKAQNQT